MALPSSNISVPMVKSAIGSGSNDVGTLCTHPNINKWSRWKPIGANAPGGVSEIILKNAQCGLNIPMVNGEDELINYYRANNNPIWTYNRPRGLAYNEGYRLGDFRNYEHTARRLYSGITAPSTVIAGSNPKVNASIILDTPQTWAVTWDSLMFENLYFGIVVVRSGIMTPRSLKYADEPIVSVEGGSVKTDILSPSIGATYEIHTFIGPKSEFNPNSMGRGFVLEEGFKTFQYIAAAKVVLTGTKLPGSNSVAWTLRIINNTASPLVLNTSTVWVRYGDKAIDDAMEIGEANHLIGNITVTASGEYNNSGTFNGVLEDYGTRGGYLYYSNTSNPTLNQRSNLYDPR